MATSATFTTSLPKSKKKLLNLLFLDFEFNIGCYMSDLSCFCITIDVEFSNCIRLGKKRKVNWPFHLLLWNHLRWLNIAQNVVRSLHPFGILMQIDHKTITFPSEILRYIVNYMYLKKKKPKTNLLINLWLIQMARC